MQDLYNSDILAGIKNKQTRLEAAKRIERIVLKSDYKDYRRNARKSQENRVMAAVCHNAANQFAKEWYTSTHVGGSGTYPGSDKLKDQTSYTNSDAAPNSKNIKQPSPSKYPDVPTCVKAITALGVDVDTANSYCQ